ncbi:cubilin-like isoform X2 [Pomacea canaliculata]|uniref:cubilin-like isoform X2 n=1 Tax=Pomacea canaliculata TaxID=400727 RepID=UPI000D7370CB|nr:cubilin-like isoform X2 [Pomacea canaliculata]
MHCTTTLSVPSSFRIRIYLRRLNFSDPHSGACSEGDFLHFRDLQSDVQTTVTCADPHRDGQLLFESSGSQVEVLFVSDHVTQGEGFELSYAGVPSCQNETYSQYSGAVFSINFPRHYPNMQECFYTINVSEHDNIIELSFPSFFTESDAASDARLRDGRCTRDFVEIFDGEAIHKVCGNWSGKEHLLLFRSRANVLVFRFVSDEQITRPGFYATWQTIKGNNKTCLSTWIDTGHLCFQVMYNPQTWDDGEADCISRGGHLASLLDSDTQRLLNDHILSQTCTDWEAFWIGGSDREWESDFYWTDGSKVVFTNWFPGVPFDRWRRFDVRKTT